MIVLKRQWILLLLIACFSSQLQTTHAKGGGHGGGGGGRGGRGGRRRGAPPEYKRDSDKLTTGFTLWHLNPLGYHNLPNIGETILVLIDAKTKQYVPGNVTEVHGAKSFTVEFESNGERIRAHLFGQPNVAWVFIIVFGYLACVFRREELQRRQFQERAKAFDDRFEKAGSVNNPPPLSGTYVGKTIESDGSKQIVKVQLEILPEGAISGNGRDSWDGPYTVQGKWSGNCLSWKETYDRFTVQVRGVMQEDNKRIECFFRSSRNIQGDVTLEFQQPTEAVPQNSEKPLVRRRETAGPTT